jgi:NAD(P)H-hydrate epimerase
MKIARVSEMRDLDRRASEEFGVTEALLMENAGGAAYFVIHSEFGVKLKHFVIFCGVGNNGGDGLVLARKLHSNGAQVTVFILGDPKKFKGAAKTNYDIARRLDIEISTLKAIDDAWDALDGADAIIDAIFGTGLTRAVEGNYRETIEMINESELPIFSLDIPSGIHGDTGQIMGVAVLADCTITFGLPKLGNLLFPGFDYGGKLYVTHISFPPELYNSPEIKIAANDPLPLFPRRSDTHKGSYGKTLFIAGSANYLGAPYFAAMSFLKAGGGLSFLAAPEPIAPFIGNKGSEIIFVPQKATATGSIASENKKQILEFCEKVDLVVMGPGLSLNHETQNLVRTLAAQIPKPLLLDGDGLTAIASDLSGIKKRKAPTILTPHLAEMARLTQKDTDEISKNKIDVLQATARQLNATIVLKGAHSLVGYPDGRVFINLTGNPGMATAGSGDVLTGAIAAMAGLGLLLEAAVRMGVFLHGFAGDLAAQEIGQDGMVAEDIMKYLPKALKTLRENFVAITENSYNSIFVV